MTLKSIEKHLANHSFFSNPWLADMIADIEAEIAERFIELPEGWTGEQAADVLAYWPTWDDGSPCMFGDEFTCYPKYDYKKDYKILDRLVIFGPNHVWNRGCDDEGPHDGGYYEWNFMRPGGDGCEEYRPTKRKPRTVEDVLRDYWREACELPVAMSDESTAEAIDKLVVKYRAEICELRLMEVDR
ncbi:MAG: hypothetical protein IKF14_05165 [Atopobiaceae bacterium]|nr:hypothetical protein [Atopobiaceae bacterium]MBR3158479.1 hypothetical protein [Atopobiaceae bacterium]